MSFRGGNRGGRGGARGGFRGGRGGSSGGGRGGFRNNNSFSQGPPDTVLEMGAFIHPCEGELVCKSINTKIPYFNAPIYLANKSQIGKVDEILGPLNELYFTVKLQDGIQATSFKKNDKVYIGGDKLLPLERFLPKPKDLGGKSGKPVGRQGLVEKRGGRGGARGGFSRGSPRGRGGPSRGGPRGGAGGRGGFRGASRGRGGFGRGR